MAVNATGTYLATKAFLPDMIEAGWGRIVNMSSVSGQRTATTDEVAAVFAFLSSQDASYLTGTTVDINGGSHMH